MITATQRIGAAQPGPSLLRGVEGDAAPLASLGRETIHDPGKAIVQEGRTAMRSMWSWKAPPPCG